MLFPADFRFPLTSHSPITCKFTAELHKFGNNEISESNNCFSYDNGEGYKGERKKGGSFFFRICQPKGCILYARKNGRLELLCVEVLLANLTHLAI